MNKFLLSLIFILQISLASAATPLNGVVIAKSESGVKVNFRPSNNAWPAEGDQIEFFTELDGIKVSAGEGRIKQTLRGTSVWAEIDDNRPAMNMSAVIHATSKLYSKIKEFAFTLEGRDDINFRGYLIQGWPDAAFKVKLPDSYEYKSYVGSSASFYIPASGSISVGYTVTSSDSLKRQHEEQWRIRIPNEMSTISEIIWRNRTIQGAAVSCIASRALLTESHVNDVDGRRKYNYRHLFFASCSPHQQPTRKDNANLVYDFDFRIDASGKDDISADYWENQFLDALRSLSITLNY